VSHDSEIKPEELKRPVVREMASWAVWQQCMTEVAPARDGWSPGRFGVRAGDGVFFPYGATRRVMRRLRLAFAWLWSGIGWMLLAFIAYHFGHQAGYTGGVRDLGRLVIELHECGDAEPCQWDRGGI
jgi:hypothetical protein